MSDSDSTVPATDDFTSRFLEIDEYSCEQPEKLPKVRRSNSPLRQFNPHANPTNSAPVAISSTRVKNYSSFPASRKRRITNPLGTQKYSDYIDPDYTDDDDSEDRGSEDDEVSAFRHPKLLTARQLSLQSQRSVDSQSSRKRTNLAGIQSALLSLESLNPPKPSVPLTAEQMAARQRRIARRRESAKHKAELEKRLTVERLLKINDDSIGRRGRGRGRWARGRLSHSVSTQSVTSMSAAGVEPLSGSELDSNDKEFEIDKASSASNENPSVESVESAKEKRQITNNTSACETFASGPRPGYIRVISSTRLNHVKLLCLPSPQNLPAYEAEYFAKAFASYKTPDRPLARLCDLGCGRPRRYECAKTGRSLCSLQCYKLNLARHTKDSILISI